MNKLSICYIRLIEDTVTINSKHLFSAYFYQNIAPYLGGRDTGMTGGGGEARLRAGGVAWGWSRWI